jgi:hypothetical protein
MNFSSISIEHEQGLAFSAIGQAITSWSQIEAQLCNVFAAALGQAYAIPGKGFVMNGGCSDAFYAVDNFRAKLSMTDQVFRGQVRDIYCADMLLDCWTKAHNRARKMSGKHNHFAHWTMIRFEMNDRVSGFA